MDPYNPIIVDLMDSKRKQIMLERLEKFEAPRHWTQLVPGAVLLIVAIAILAWLDSTVTPEQVEPKIPQQAGATQEGERASLAIPFAHPLGCPEEDEAGRPLRATLSIKGEKRPRCYYGGAQ
mgnify:CR=1 FL=1